MSRLVLADYSEREEEERNEDEESFGEAEFAKNGDEECEEEEDFAEKGDEEFSNGDDNSGSESEENLNNVNEAGLDSVEGQSVVEGGLMESVDFAHLTPTEFKKLQFPTAECAYYFYNEYGRVNGFGIRRSKMRRNEKKETIWLKFVCNKEGYREKKYFNLENRKREQRALSRCGCCAELRVKYNYDTGMWNVVKLCDKHNHDLIGERCIGHSRSHRKLFDGDIAQFNSLRKAGISTSKIFGSFVVQSGSHADVGFGLKQLHNQLEKQRKLLDSDLKEALKYLAKVEKEEGGMYWKYLLADDGSFLHLFWCDGVSQLDYKLFGDVLAFDATYRKNRYKLPVIIFSGVNHHKQTCVFATAIVSNETTETYVWVLQQFLQAMKGTCPKTIVTDGDMSIRNAILEVFPEAHHRLCSWHLLRNATSNVHKPYFTKQLKKLMLYDYEVSKFEEKWKKLVEECGLEDNAWVNELYKKKMLWASAHIRGKFFAGLSTTSRCEGLHSVVGRYVKKGYNFVEFIEQYQRCLENLRNNEVAADFKSLYTEPVMQTELVALERCGAQVYTRVIFDLFRTVLKKSSTILLSDIKETPSARIYIMGKWCTPNVKWHVCFYPHLQEFRCTCQCMESIGIPCCHIISVMLHLDMKELPKSLVLDRWTRGVKEGLCDKFGRDISRMGSMYKDIQYGAVLHCCRELCKLACGNAEDLAELMRTIQKEKTRLKEKHANANNAHKDTTGGSNLVQGSQNSMASRKRNKSQKCTICRKEGHNRATCPYSCQLQHLTESSLGCSTQLITENESEKEMESSSNDEMDAVNL